MTALRLAGFVSLLSLTLGMSACAAPTSEDEELTGEDASELRALTPDEILGEIHYGDVVTIPYTGSPWYRAYWFNGEKGDWMNVTVSSSTGDIRAFLTDDQFRQVPRGMAMALRKTGKYYVAVREGQYRDATLTINFKKRPLPTPAPAPTAAE